MACPTDELGFGFGSPNDMNGSKLKHCIECSAADELVAHSHHHWQPMLRMCKRTRVQLPDPAVLVTQMTFCKTLAQSNVPAPPLWAFKHECCWVLQVITSPDDHMQKWQALLETAGGFSLGGWNRCNSLPPFVPNSDAGTTT